MQGGVPLFCVARFTNDEQHAFFVFSDSVGAFAFGKKGIDPPSRSEEYQPMLPLATEFPISPITDRAAFVDLAVRWLRGTQYSVVLDDPSAPDDMEQEFVHLRAKNGEELRIRGIRRDNTCTAIGFRHDYPDDEGRLWRTESVVRCRGAENGQDLIRIRTQCIAQEPGARLDVPRKPYLIKLILSEGHAGEDGVLPVSDQPLWLASDADGLEVARRITNGDAMYYLPVIYISSIGSPTWIVSRKQIEKLAFDMGGIAHVVVEPDRRFSLKLRILSESHNVYGGTWALALPKQGVVRRFYLGWRLPTAKELLDRVREVAIAARSQMPAKGWDWTELQEQALRLQRERDRNRLSAKETEQLYEEEIANLQERVKELEGQLATGSPAKDGERDDGLLPAAFIDRIGPEIYLGELVDRLRYAVKTCLERADQIGLDRRSKALFEKIIGEIKPSPELHRLVKELRRVTKDKKRVGADLTRLLEAYGYREKSDRKHIRLEAKKGYVGLDAVTLPKTPGENRGLENLRKQIERALGITKLNQV